MRVVSPLELRRSLGAILDAASAGERILVERDRRPVAMLVSVEDGRRLEDDPDERRTRAMAALDRLVATGERRAAEGWASWDAKPGAADAVRADRRRDG
jgi:antitoxin (DNA-binding transcriptional repressor) of toxin-antitoxin stability system